MSGARASPHPLFYDTVFFRAVALFADAIIYNVVPYLYLLSIPVMGLMASATFGKFLDADKIGCRKFVSINVLLLALCPSLHRAAHNFFLGADAPLLSVAAIAVQLLVWLTCSRVFATSLCYGYALLHVLPDRGANSGFAATAFRDALCQQRGQALGRRVCIVGNGPSVVRKEGQAPLGDCIDHFDEVVRFNHFFADDGALAPHRGTKTTLHVSNTHLFGSRATAPSSATALLPLFTSDLGFSLLHLVFRIGPSTGRAATPIGPIGLRRCIRHLAEAVSLPLSYQRNVALRIGLPHNVVPTSGLFAIEIFVELLAAGEVDEVCITGFDCFASPDGQRHYFDKYEPWLERVLTPWMERIEAMCNTHGHRPDLERTRVQALVDEGKVKLLHSSYG